MEEEEAAARLRQAKSKRDGGAGQDAMLTDEGGVIEVVVLEAGTVKKQKLEQDLMAQQRAEADALLQQATEMAKAADRASDNVVGSKALPRV